MEKEVATMQRSNSRWILDNERMWDLIEWKKHRNKEKTLSNE